MNKKELLKISVKFRNYASQMLKIEEDSEINRISTFLNFIEETPVLDEYVKKCHRKYYNIDYDMHNKMNWTSVSLPSDDEALIDYCFQILDTIRNNPQKLYSWAIMYQSDGNMPERYRKFMRKTIEPFVTALRSYLEVELLDSENEDIVENDDKKQVFLSYCQRDTPIADLIDSSLCESIKEFAKISRDIRDVEFGESFKIFMDSIGKHDFVIVIISDGYLKSRNCMYEMKEITRNQKLDDKLLFVILSQEDKQYYCDDSVAVAANVYESSTMTNCTTYWQGKQSELEKEIECINNVILSIEQAKELKIIQQILMDLPDFLAYLKDRKGLTLVELISSDFSEFVEIIQRY